MKQSIYILLTPYWYQVDHSLKRKKKEMRY